MLKNVASQAIGAQMIDASDGSAFTGAVTVSVTGDAGTQATGSVGSGACTHEGNGYHTYAPAQAETNYNLVAFTFTGTGAIPVTVQIYTLPTTGVLAPATLGRTLTVDASGNGNANLVNIAGSAVSTSTAQLGVNVVNAAGTAWGSGAITAVSIATGAITNAKFASGAIDATAIASNAIAAAKIASGAITNAKFAAGAIDAAAIANGAIDAATFAADVDAEILSYLVDDATRIDASALNTAAVTSIPAILVDTGTTLDGKLDTIDNNVDSILADTGTDGVVVAAASKTGYTLSTAGLAAFFTTDSGETYGDAVAGSVVKETADNAGGSALTVQDIVDGVWDEAQASHVGAGTFGLIASEIADILTDTAEIGAAGAGLTAINLPNQTMDIVGNITGNLSGSVGSVTDDVNISSNRKKAAEATFVFTMTDSTTGDDTEGLTVSGVISKDGGAFAATSNSVTEIDNGYYSITLTSTEMNADNIALQFTATGAVTRDISIQAQP